MNKLSLYNENERYTELAIKLDREIGSILNSFIEKCSHLGISMRELHTLISMAVTDIILEQIIKNDTDRFNGANVKNAT